MTYKKGLGILQGRSRQPIGKGGRHGTGTATKYSIAIESKLAAINRGKRETGRCSHGQREQVSVPRKLQHCASRVTN